MKPLFTFAFFLLCCCLNAQQAPVFGPEIPVTINSYTIDAMEPFISPDGNALFFNSINNAVNTSLFYASKSDDTTFNLVGLVPVVNQTVTPFLNAVASVDTGKNFYWVSTRDYPTDYDNLHRIRFLTSGYTNFGKVRGDFNIHTPGWLIMDAAINTNGDYLYYCNAFFQGTSCNGGLPCKGRLGIAGKVNDSTFNKLPNSDAIMASVNDTNYVVYAPQISSDGLELYYTRFPQTALLNTEICVAVRTNTLQAFGTPSVIYSANGLVPEAPTITTDKNKLYYHKKQGGTYKIFMRYRQLSLDINKPTEKKLKIVIKGNTLFINGINHDEKIIFKVYSIDGKLLITKTINIGGQVIRLHNISPGIYLVSYESEKYTGIYKIAITE